MTNAESSDARANPDKALNPTTIHPKFDAPWRMSGRRCAVAQMK